MSNEVVAGRYALVREIGRGASATVYLAHDQTLDRDIALKIVAPALANDPTFVDRFMREARISASLNHPNIVTVHDTGETADHRPVLAMALVNGTSLERVIEESAPLPQGEASRILTELARALDYLHGQGLIHRDIKPSNVLIEESGRVMLSDFGVAYAREASRYTMTGLVLGTPRYMAPEQMLGEEPTPQTDVYAMGVLAFEMLAGAPPFEGTGTALMYKIVHEPPPPVSSLAPNIPPGIEQAIARALLKDPLARWPTPGEFAAAIASPDASATMVGATPVVPVASAPPVAAPPAAEPLAPEPEPAAASSSDAGGGSRFGGRKALFGAGGAALLGLAVSSYCLAAGGANPPASEDDEATATTVPGGIQASATPVPAIAIPTNTPPVAATPTQTPISTPVPPATPTPPPTATWTPTATPTVAPPNAPSNIVLSNGNKTISWQDNSNNETGFRIYWRATDLNGGAVTVVNDKTVGANTGSTSVEQVILIATMTDFRRGVSAYNAGGESAIVWDR